MHVEVSNGFAYLGGTFTKINGKDSVHLACVTAGPSDTGELTTNWDCNCSASINTMALNSFGDSFFVGGTCSFYGAMRSNAAAFNIATGELTGWDPNTNGAVKAIALGNGAAYIGGSFTTVGGDSASTHLAKTNISSGAVETDGGSKWSADGDVNALLINPVETNIYVGGPFATIKSVNVSNAEGYVLSTGNRMTGWNNYLTASNMTTTNSLVWFNPSSSVFVGGWFQYKIVSPSVDIENFGKCSLSGTLDTTYDANVPGVVQAACTDNVSMVIVAGNGFIKSYNTGSAASGWSKTLVSPTKDVFAMQYSSSGKLYVGGNFSYTEGSVSRNFLSCFDVTLSGQPLENWGPVFDQAGVYAMSAGADMIVVGGTFNTIDGKSHQGIAAIDIATGKAWE
jgi:hypothetical protein